MAIAPRGAVITSGAPLALPPLLLPGGTGPLPEPPAQAGETLWGVNRAAALDNFPLDGLQLHITPWSSMGFGDTVTVTLDGTTVVASETIDTDEVNLPVITFIPPQRITAGRHTLTYQVKRFGQGPDPSAPTNTLVKLDRPGGQDQNGSTPGHSELILSLPPDIIDNGVDAGTAKDGVPVTVQTYPNMTAGDDITLSWGGQLLHHHVTDQEVDAAQPLQIQVEEATILAAGDSGENGLAVTFEVYDIVQNRSEDWAAEIRIVVDTGNSRLAPPVVKEASDNVLDLDILLDAPATVQVTAVAAGESLEHLTSCLGDKQIAQIQASMGKDTLEGLLDLKGDFTRGDRIVVAVRGTASDGTAVSYESPEVTIDNLPHVYDIEVPNLVIRKLVQAQAVFSYSLRHVDGTESKSRGTFVSVVGLDLPDIPVITSVIDSSGTAIPNGGITTSTTVSLFGTIGQAPKSR